MAREIPLKREILSEICALLRIPKVETTVGSTIPRVFFSDVSSALGIPEGSSMPDTARRIIESYGLLWNSEFSSEDTRSGGGSTVTASGLLQILNAVRIWKGLDPTPIPGNAGFIEWSPTELWIERRAGIQRVEKSASIRPGASVLRDLVLTAYGSTCALTGTTSVEVLEVAHIVPYFGIESDVIPNCVLLRADLHTLFDAGLLRILFDTPQRMFVSQIHDRVMGDYAQFHQRSLHIPSRRDFWPSKEALRIKQELHKSLWQVI